MRDAVIVEAVRTPVGKRNGGLSGVHPADLSAHVLNSLVQRAGVDPALVDDVIWGCVSQIGEQTFDIARTAVLAAGWPETVPGVTVDRQCGSSQQAVHFAAAGLVAGQYDVVVAGGVESMSRVPMGSTVAAGRRQPVLAGVTLDRYDGVFPNQGVGAEMIAEQWGCPGSSSTSSRVGLAREGRRRPRRGPVRGADRPGHPARRHRDQPGRGHPREHRGEARHRSRRCSSPRAGSSPPATRRRSPTAPPRC